MVKYKKNSLFFVCFALLPSLKVEESLSGLSKDFSGVGVHELPTPSVIYTALAPGKTMSLTKGKKSLLCHVCHHGTSFCVFQTADDGKR